MKMKVFILSLFISILGILGCAEQGQIPTNAVSVDNPTVDIFAARGFLGGSSYERYFLKNGELFRECGDLKEEPNPFPSTIAPGIFATHTSIYPKDGSKVSLNSEDLIKLQDAISATIRSLSNDTSLAKLDMPQSPFRLAQGGVFELKIANNSKSYQIKTSLDQLTADNNKQLLSSLKLFTILRSFGLPMCNSQVFFGVGR